MFVVVLLIALASVGLGILPHAVDDKIHAEIQRALGTRDQVTVRFEQIPSWKLLQGEVAHVWLESPGIEIEGQRLSRMSAALGPIKPGQPIPTEFLASFDQSAIQDMQLPGLPDIALENVHITFAPFNLQAEAVVMGFIRLPVALMGELAVQDGQLVLTRIAGKAGDQDLVLPDLPLFSPPPGWTLVEAQPDKTSVQLHLRGHLRH